MKTIIATSILAALLTSGVAVMAQGQNEDYLGLPGDNLNLYAAMKLFQESKTLEEFEMTLNDEDSRINNLDLNGDNLIDYINVFDNVNGNVHNIVMQVAVNKWERQDVAVFTVERDRNGNVMIQLTGDEALYGKNYIIEPAYNDELNGLTPNPGYAGNAVTINGRQVNVVTTTTVEIANWPVIRYIYNPGYVVWRSSWYWGYYPDYWNPWRPYSWHYYYGYHCNWYDHYYAYYHRSHYHHHNYWHDYYYHPYHAHSDYVAMNIKGGHYKSTYSHPEDRKKGEALYSTAHKDQNVQRMKDVRISDQSRRTTSDNVAERQNASAARSSSRRSEGNATARTLSKTNTNNYRKQMRRTDPVYTANAESRTSSGRKNSEPARTATASSDRRSATTPSVRRSAEERPAVHSRQSASASRPAVESRSSASKSHMAVNTKPAESKSREIVSRQAAPERKDSKPRETGTRVSQSKSKESDTRKELKSESKRR